MKLGDVGNDVKLLKKKLLSCGYSVESDSIDFCEYTKEAVKRVQIYYGLDPTGIYDNLTEDLLTWEARVK